MQRCRVPELMDDPALSCKEHWDALKGLARINRWSRTAASLGPILEKLCRNKQQPLRVLDVACGGGDITITLARWAQQRHLPIHFAACDISEDALTYAMQKAEHYRLNIHFFRCNVLVEQWPENYDVVMSSLFLHHLDEADVVALLSRMANAARELVLVNDLRRSRVGWWLAYLGTRLLTRSPIVHVDGPRSVCGAFTIAEAHQLAVQANLVGATIQPCWPFRWLLTWRKPQERA